jgi:anaerobic selenocysteine-containing dehydrogenase
VKAFVGLGGNFLRAVPDTARMEQAWRRLRLTVQIATKPNRSQIVHGEIAYILPCLGRIEIDRTGGIEQSVSMEDSTGCIHASRGVTEPASPLARSEPWIIAGLAGALLPQNTRTPWDAWASDYSLVRLAIERTYPDIFREFERRRWQPGGFARPLAARQRIWKTGTAAPAAC